MKNIIIFILGVILLGSCKSKEKLVEVPIIKTEVKYIDKLIHDSVYQKDSIFTYIKGDTIYNTKYRDRFKYKFIKDTVNVNKVDTITKIQKVETIKVKNQLNVLQKVLIGLGIISTLLLAFILYIKFKK